MGEVVKRHFSQVLMQEGALIYGNQALVTVTSVLMSPDMGIAKVYLSVYNVDSKQEILLELEQEANRLKHQFAKRVRSHMRRVPQLQLYLDDTLDTMYHLNSVFDRLRRENQMGEEE